jgi:hypothetical protein
MRKPEVSGLKSLAGKKPQFPLKKIVFLIAVGWFCGYTVLQPIEGLGKPCILDGENSVQDFSAAWQGRGPVAFLSSLPATHSVTWIE